MKIRKVCVCVCLKNDCYFFQPFSLYVEEVDKLFLQSQLASVLIQFASFMYACNGIECLGAGLYSLY